MDTFESLSHSKWECKYHVVFIPKCRRKALYGELRKHLGEDVAPERAESFYAAIRTYWPGLPDNALAPDYAGVRPKIMGRGQPVADFVIDSPRRHGIPGLVHLFGIESFGLTAGMAIAEEVADQMEGVQT